MNINKDKYKDKLYSYQSISVYISLYQSISVYVSLCQSMSVYIYTTLSRAFPNVFDPFGCRIKTGPPTDLGQEPDASPVDSPFVLLH